MARSSLVFQSLVHAHLASKALLARFLQVKVQTGVEERTTIFDQLSRNGSTLQVIDPLTKKAARQNPCATEAIGNMNRSHRQQVNNATCAHEKYARACLGGDRG